jgi:phosphoenolpyruvate carboxylase
MARSGLHFDPKDAGLRRDVHLLGELVGEVLREQGGEGLYRRVERSRRSAIARREDPADGGQRLRQVVAALAPADAAELVRGFSAYFQVVNLAERVHRIRRRREWLRTQSEPQPEGLWEAVRALRQSGRSLPEVLELLAQVQIEPVFTAHPTEATRRSILEKQQRIGATLLDRLDSSRTLGEERAARERLRAEIAAAWQTDEHPAAKPAVADEREHVLFFVRGSVARCLPAFYEALEDALEAEYGQRPGDLPLLLRFGSWVGGDMDGNPSVTAATVRESVLRHRTLALDRCRRDVEDLAARLTQSIGRVGVDPEVLARVQAHAALLPDGVEIAQGRYRDMPYRTLLLLAARRLQATARDEAGAYAGPDELLADLALVQRSLEANRGGRAGAFWVRRVLRRAATFGFHLLTLDVRQDSAVHRRVLARLLGDPSFEERSRTERAAAIAAALRSGAAPAEPDQEARRTLDVFAAIAEARRRGGERAVGPFIVSMTEGADDVLAVLLLARWAGLLRADGTPDVDVAPLFETVEDLEAAPRVMAELAADPLYAAHLAARGRRQLVMVGYSDSNKDGGFAASRFAIRQAQVAVAEVLDAAGIAAAFFHGRGGSTSRGSGKAHRAILASPPGTLRGRLRVTEQGETISAHYGLAPIALRTLERSAAATLLSTAGLGGPAPGARFQDLLAEVAAESGRAYRALVHDDPDLFPYFRAATPIDVIERLPMGSRPASRRSQRGIRDLRAIPWVFAWTQSRHLLPGWYGLGAALDAVEARHGLAVLQEMAQGFLFFATLLDDAEMVLAKADLDIAAHYAELAGEAGRRVFPRIRAEFERTRAAVLRVKAQSALLAADPVLARSIRLRNPYVDPMSLLQVDLLRRWREGERRDEAVLKALLATVNGIAHGLQNTG